MRGRIYGIAELDRALPLIRSIVADVMRTNLEVRDALVRAGVGAMKEPVDEDDLLRRLPFETRDLLDDLRDYVLELGELGIFLRDPSTGLVEAYGEQNGEIVYYTWKLGEERVKFWHGLFGSHHERHPVHSLV